jgi:hypothetical protein
MPKEAEVYVNSVVLVELRRMLHCDVFTTL